MISDAVVKDLLEQLTDENELVRYCAANVLVRHHRNHSECINALLKLLRSDSNLVVLFIGNHQLLFPEADFEKENFFQKYSAAYGFGTWSFCSRVAQILAELAKWSSETEASLAQKIEQYHAEDFIGNYVEALWEIVV